MIERARKIMGGHLFTTVQDYNTLLEGVDELEEVAKENRQNLSPEQRKKEIERRQKKIEELNDKAYQRSKQGRNGRGSMGLQLDSYARTKEILRQQIELLETNS